MCDGACIPQISALTLASKGKGNINLTGQTSGWQQLSTCEANLSRLCGPDVQILVFDLVSWQPFHKKVGLAGLESMWEVGHK